MRRTGAVHQRITQVSQGQLSEDGNLAWSKRAKAGLIQMFRKVLGPELVAGRSLKTKDGRTNPISMPNRQAEIRIAIEDARARADEEHARSVSDIARLRRAAVEHEVERVARKRRTLCHFYDRLTDVGHREPAFLRREKDERFKELNEELAVNSNTWSSIAERLRGLADDHLKETRLTLEQIACQLATKPPFESVRQTIDVAAGHLRAIINRKFPDSELQGVAVARRQGLNLVETLRAFSGELEEVYHVLHEAGHLWADHVKRFGLAQKTTLVRLEERITKNDADELANEVGFNIELERLRQCPDAGALEQLNAAMCISLGRMMDATTDRCTEELALLEELMAVPPVLGNLLLAEFECYFIKYPRVVLEETINASSGSPHSSQKNIGTIVSPLNPSLEGCEANMEEGAENDECAETSRHLNSGESIDTAQGFEEASNDTSNVEVLAMVNGPIAQALAEAERRLAALRVRRNRDLVKPQVPEVIVVRTTGVGSSLPGQREALKGLSTSPHHDVVNVERRGNVPRYVAVPCTSTVRQRRRGTSRHVGRRGSIR
ncbi:hypothetical protein EVAR_43288_1 [Eumeta japonica]|uniref:Uncharacterized protein n=1 Tax=Eumeta variegata TaxID=151549 RepID=A0A4C1X1V7_EUMVA|nr:hypothetical protein EVAR_43288_1 [Eumeta japonica]